MNCQTFDLSLLDALYDELDASVSSAMDEHVAGCEACAMRLARLRKTRELVGPALEVPVPDGLEARILAAAEAAMMDAGAAPAASVATGDLREREARPAEVIALADRKKKNEDGGVIGFLSRPQLAVAATFVLVLGATALLVGTSSKREAPASMAQAPAAEAAREPAPAAATAPADLLASAVANAEPPPAAAPVPSPAAAPMSDPNAIAMKTGRASAKAATERRRDPSFDAAMALYEAGRYAEALPRFRALASSHPEAELYVARCIANTQGCGPALAQYDRAATTNAGTESGSRAAFEAAQCASRSGQATAARTRYQNLTNDGYVGTEAQSELARLDAPHAPAVKAAKPAATATATAPPRAAPPAETPR